MVEYLVSIPMVLKFNTKVRADNEKDALKTASFYEALIVKKLESHFCYDDKCPYYLEIETDHGSVEININIE